MKNQLEEIREEFNNFMVDEYGKWKIGREEAIRFMIEKLKLQRLNLLEEIEKGLSREKLPKVTDRRNRQK